jgi:hypothetical protein
VELADEHDFVWLLTAQVSTSKSILKNVKTSFVVAHCCFFYSHVTGSWQLLNVGMISLALRMPCVQAAKAVSRTRRYCIASSSVVLNPKHGDG